MPHDLNDAKVFDVNGGKYRVGVDDHGWVQIQSGELRHDPEKGVSEFVPYERGDEVSPHPTLDETTASDVADYIQSLVS